MCGYSLFRHPLFDSIKGKYHFNSGSDYIEKFCAGLKKHATEIINHEKKEVLPVIDEEIKSNNNKHFCHICNTKFCNIVDTNDDSDNNNYRDSNQLQLWLAEELKRQYECLE